MDLPELARLTSEFVDAVDSLYDAADRTGQDSPGEARQLSREAGSLESRLRQVLAVQSEIVALVDPEADSPPSSSTPIRALLREVHLLAPDQLAAVVSARARELGAREAVIYLADYEQLLLQPLRGAGVPARQELSIDGSLGGRAFRRVEVVTVATNARGQRMWLPLLDGVDRLGVMELVVGEATPAFQNAARALVALAAELLVVTDNYTDIFSRLRRRKTLSLAAEIQWELLPPLTFASDRVVIAGALEPAYDIGGDSFDYAVNGPVVDWMVLDAVGHGLPAALLASAAVGTYRHARRNMVDLPDVAWAVNEVIASQFTDSRFATAAIARLHLDTGQLRWVNAGHPDPLIIRNGAMVSPGTCRPHPPLGLQTRKAEVCETQLHVGDRVVLYTDGIVEARSPEGEFFGEERLVDFIHRANALGDAAPETLRRLMRRIMEHQADHLQDDASVVMLEWRTGDERQLQV
ncbi:PP2C family protein-serine/threonine phosphatase [Modestobacter italicus]|uniref:PP2C family protein-serine/threonine phosphatase n=1 Tax=Modestobacter italicus (strain DSM 44449 / CECT 9708 / BC 501) TaxID=2732864 RepID=UPI0002EB8DE8|nr:PP2C family protein-serine/threonine phosphatase [Modestobacter marinus]